MENDTSWPAGLARAFSAMTTGRSGANRYYGPYIALLFYCFDSGNCFDYVMCPQVENDGGRIIPVDDIVYVIVTNNKGVPMMFLEVKDDHWFDSPFDRARAHKEMRDKFDELAYKCPLETLYGISFLGKRMQVYRCRKTGQQAGEVLPLEPPKPPGVPLPANYMSNMWSIDILSQEGFDEMKRITTWIRSQNSTF